MHRLTAMQQSATATPAAAPTLRARVLAVGMPGGTTSTVDGEALPDTDVVEVPPHGDTLAVTEAAAEPVGRGETLPVADSVPGSVGAELSVAVLRRVCDTAGETDGESAPPELEASDVAEFDADLVGRADALGHALAPLEPNGAAEEDGVIVCDTDLAALDVWDGEDDALMVNAAELFAVAVEFAEALDSALVVELCVDEDEESGDRVEVRLAVPVALKDSERKVLRVTLPDAETRDERDSVDDTDGDVVSDAGALKDLNPENDVVTVGDKLMEAQLVAVAHGVTV